MLIKSSFFLFSVVFFSHKLSNSLNQVGNVAGHLFDSCVIVLFQFLKRATITLGDEVDSNTLAAETTTATDSKKEKVFH